MGKFLSSLFVIVALVASASAQVLAPLHAELVKKWPGNRTVNIVFHGHSVPSGYHVTPDVRPFESYPHLVHVGLKGKFPHAVLNVIVTAIGGEASPAGAERFSRDVLPHRPDLVLIDYALNDRGVAEDQVEASWLGMIRAAKEAGVPVVLITPTGDATSDMANPADPLTQRAALIRKLAAAENVILADVSAAWLAELAKGTPQADLLSQVNHPNLRGHQLAADAIMKALAEAGLVSAEGR
jgi:lysophospholipase L1-like esterase